jgi:hypothetical protein
VFTAPYELDFYNSGLLLLTLGDNISPDDITASQNKINVFFVSGLRA